MLDGRGRRRLALRQRGLWLDALAITVAVGGLLLVAVSLNVLPGSRAWGFDFGAYFRAAVRLAETGTPYAADTLAGAFRPGPAGLYLYSPLLAQVLQPLVGLGEASAALAWYALRVGALVAACLLMPISLRLRLAMIGIAGLSLVTLVDLGLGNVSLIVTLLTVIAWRYLDRPAAGVAVALTLFLRPTMGLLLGWWLVRGRYRPLAWAVGGGLVLVVLSVALIGLRPYVDYVTLLGNLTDVTGVPFNIDLASVAWHLGAPPALVQLALLSSYLLAVGAVLLSLRRDRELSFAVVSVAVLFAAPLLWDHYLTQLLVPAALLASRGRWWGLALPLLTWLPQGSLAFVALAALIALFLAPDRGEPALSSSPFGRWLRTREGVAVQRS